MVHEHDRRRSYRGVDGVVRDGARKIRLVEAHRRQPHLEHVRRPRVDDVERVQRPAPQGRRHAEVERRDAAPRAKLRDVSHVGAVPRQHEVQQDAVAVAELLPSKVDAPEAARPARRAEHRLARRAHDAVAERRRLEVDIDLRALHGRAVALHAERAPPLPLDGLAVVRRQVAPRAQPRRALFRGARHELSHGLRHDCLRGHVAQAQPRDVATVRRQRDVDGRAGLEAASDRRQRGMRQFPARLAAGATCVSELDLAAAVDARAGRHDDCCGLALCSCCRQHEEQPWQRHHGAASNSEQPRRTRIAKQ